LVAEVVLVSEKGGVEQKQQLFLFWCESE